MDIRPAGSAHLLLFLGPQGGRFSGLFRYQNSVTFMFSVFDRPVMRLTMRPHTNGEPRALPPLPHTSVWHGAEAQGQLQLVYLNNIITEYLLTLYFKFITAYLSGLYVFLITLF